MGRRLLTTALALLLAAGLAAGAWHLAREPVVERVSELTAEEAMSIRMQRPDRPPVSLERRNGEWWVTHPEEQPASDMHVRGVLRILDEPLPEQRIPAHEVTPERYGLDSPAAVLEINGKSWHFGDRHPVGEQRYVLHEGEILLLPDNYAPLLRGPWQQLTGDGAAR